MKNENEITQYFESNGKKILPIYFQIAEQIVEKFHIQLVVKIEASKATPYYYSGGKYNEDRNYEIIKGFVVAEILEIFNSKEIREISNTLFIKDYIILKSHFSKYINDINYVNILAKNVIESISSLNILRVNEIDFDVDDYCINARNGILNLRTGVLEKPDYHILRQCILNVNPFGNPPALPGDSKGLTFQGI